MLTSLGVKVCTLFRLYKYKYPKTRSQKPSVHRWSDVPCFGMAYIVVMFVVIVIVLLVWDVMKPKKFPPGKLFTLRRLRSLAIM